MDGYWLKKMAVPTLLGLTICYSFGELRTGLRELGGELGGGHEKAGQRIKEGLLGHMSMEGSGKDLMANGMASVGKSLENSAPCIFPQK